MNPTWQELELSFPYDVKRSIKEICKSALNSKNNPVKSRTQSRCKLYDDRKAIKFATIWGQCFLFNNSGFVDKKSHLVRL